MADETAIPWSNAFWPGLTPFGPPMWQAEADKELRLSASPTTAAGQKALALAKRRYSTVGLKSGTCLLLDYCLKVDFTHLRVR